MTKLQDFLNSPIADVSAMRRGARAGDLFGVELECEGRRVDWDGAMPDILEDWAPHPDGSLRNNHGSSCEWVFNGPVKYKKSLERVDALFDYFEKKGAKLVTSNRTSTHVHYNMGDKNAYQLVNLFIVFTILEDILGRYCGEDRNGNLFCLSSRHAEAQVDWVMDCCFKNFNLNFREDNRYCSFNMASINKFGTVEFRGMRGLDNAEELKAWLDILNDLCEYGCYKMKNPVEIVEKISQLTPMGFIKEVFSDNNVLRLTLGLSEQDINDSVYEGVRLVQMLCYKIGTEFDKVRLRGRDFWASFSSDDKPIKDVDPEVLQAPVGNPARPRRRVAQNPVEALRRAQEARNVPNIRWNPGAAQPGQPGQPAPDGLRVMDVAEIEAIRRAMHEPAQIGAGAIHGFADAQARFWHAPQPVELPARMQHAAEVEARILGNNPDEEEL